METMTAKQFRERAASPKRSKYASEMTVVDGIKFRSKKEGEYYKKLKLLQDHGEITSLVLQPRFPYHIIYTLRHPNSPVVEKKGAYVADFQITFKDGSVEIIDTKGFKTKKFIRDKEIVERLYGITIKVV